jgi:exosome complex component CSL4
MTKEKKNYVVPGERIGVIEEFSPNGPTYEEKGEIRSLVLGEVEVNKSERSVSVNSRGLGSPFPMPGDYVQGTVESLTSAGGLVRIYMINDKDVSSDITGVLRSRDRRGTSYYKLGDVVRCVVSSLSNNTIWLDMEDRDSGVIRTFCSNCGGEVVQEPPDKVRCQICDNVESRKLIGYDPPFERMERRRFSSGFRRGFQTGFRGRGHKRFRFHRSRDRRFLRR